ncbi:hypothetical protein RHECNPAF_1330027 [Rhizobium etli CNPAF512]|nr:hypothetical protein RHECNPAF_1330027 [Rhizobium etli CNPAF512]
MPLPVSELSQPPERIPCVGNLHPTIYACFAKIPPCRRFTTSSRLG